MRYEAVQQLSDEEFKRCTGVQQSTVEKMLGVVQTGLRDFGRPTKLSRADQLLMTLMYWREYRTEFHIWLDLWCQRVYGLSDNPKSRKCTDPIEAISPARKKGIAA